MRYKINQKAMSKRISRGLPLRLKIRALYYSFKYRKSAKKFTMRSFK